MKLSFFSNSSASVLLMAHEGKHFGNLSIIRPLKKGKKLSRFDRIFRQAFPIKIAGIRYAVNKWEWRRYVKKNFGIKKAHRFSSYQKFWDSLPKEKQTEIKTSSPKIETVYRHQDKEDLCRELLGFIQAGDVDAVRRSIMGGVDIHKEFMWCEDKSVSLAFSHREFKKELLPDSDFNCHIYYLNPLLFAAKLGDNAICELLIHHGADPKVQAIVSKFHRKVDRVQSIYDLHGIYAGQKVDHKDTETHVGNYQVGLRNNVATLIPV